MGSNEETKGPRPSSAKTRAHTITDDSQSTLASTPDVKPSAGRALYSSKVKSKRYIPPPQRGAVTTIKKEDKAILGNNDSKPLNAVTTPLQLNDPKRSSEATKQSEVVKMPHKVNTAVTPAVSNLTMNPGKIPPSSDASSGNDHMPDLTNMANPPSQTNIARLCNNNGGAVSDGSSELVSHSEVALEECLLPMMQDSLNDANFALRFTRKKFMCTMERLSKQLPDDCTGERDSYPGSIMPGKPNK